MRREGGLTARRVRRRVASAPSRSSVAVAVALAIVASGLAAQPVQGAQVSGAWRTTGPFGGSVNAYAFDPFDTRRVLAATNYGVFASTDSGLSWQKASRGLTYAGVSDVEFDTGVPGTAYAATYHGVFRTRDGGSSWTKQVRGATYGLAGAPQYAALYAAHYRGLKRSEDGGTTWQTMRALDPGWQVMDVVVAPSNGDVVYMSLVDINGPVPEWHLWRSSDGGETWATSPSRLELRTFVVDPNDSDTLYGIRYGTLVTSGDSGHTWTTLRPRDASWEPFDSDVTPTGRLVAVGDAVPGLAVMMSHDAGETWSLTSRMRAYRDGAIVETPDDNRVFVGLPLAGVAQSTDGGTTFSVTSKGLAAAPIRALAIDPLNPLLVYAAQTVGPPFRSLDGGRTWHAVDGRWYDDVQPYSEFRSTSVTVDASGTVYAGRVNESDQLARRVARSEDRGETWTFVDSLDTDVTDLRAHPRIPGTLFASVGQRGVARLHRSSDGGETWSSVAPSSWRQETYGFNTLTGEIFAAVADGYGDGQRAALFRSDDTGETWRRVPVPSSRISSIGIDPRTGRIMLGVTGKRIAYSDDGGTTWATRDLDPGDLSGDVSAIAWDPLDPSQVLAATLGAGLWVSRDRGNTWSSMTPGQDGENVYVAAFSPAPPEGLPGVYAARPVLTGIGGSPRVGVTRLVLPPRNIRRPVTAGVAKVGQKLTCRPRRWSRAAHFNYRWRRGGQVIATSTRQVRWLTRADGGRRLSCDVIAIGHGGRALARSPERLIRR